MRSSEKGGGKEKMENLGEKMGGGWMGGGFGQNFETKENKIWLQTLKMYA